MLELVPDPQPVFQFASGARVPAGVTVEGVLEERDRIAARFGYATAEASAQAVLEDEEEFPNLRAWGPKDAAAALKEGIERGIREAYASIKRVVIVPSKGDGEREVAVRALHAVPVEGAKGLSYESIEAIAHDTGKIDYVLETLQRDVDTYTRRLQDTVAELGQLVKEQRG